jgi:hypothetical protein
MKRRGFLKLMSALPAVLYADKTVGNKESTPVGIAKHPDAERRRMYMFGGNNVKTKMPHYKYDFETNTWSMV